MASAQKATDEMNANKRNALRTAAEAVFDHSFAPEAPLYAVVDAAREPDAPAVAREFGAQCVSLYTGDLGDKLAHVAPHLIQFRARSPFRNWWFEQWGNSIGILVEAPVKPNDLRRHFRTLMMVNGEGRERYYFRFYDPRVLRVFLPSCTSAELDHFVGPIKAFYCESNHGNELLAFHFDDEDA